MADKVTCLACGESILIFRCEQGDDKEYINLCFMLDGGPPVRITEKDGPWEKVGWIHRRCVDEYRRRMKE